MLLRFLSGSLLALMGDACGGIFEFGHGFLAQSRWNYLLAVALGAVFIAQVAFLLAGGSRLLRATHRHKTNAGRDGMHCPALYPLCGKQWARHTYLLPGDARIDAHTTGLLRPRIVLFEGIVDALDGRQLMAVIAHEEAHRSHRDNLITAVARTVSLALFYLPGPRMALGRMRAAMERDADEEAARQTGSALAVAEALARIAAIAAAAGRQDPVLSMTMSGGGSGGALAGRVQHLLSESGSVPMRRCAARIVLFSVTLLAAGAIFASSSLAVVGSDQRDAFICFTQHQQITEPAAGTCALDHSEP